MYTCVRLRHWSSKPKNSATFGTWDHLHWRARTRCGRHATCGLVHLWATMPAIFPSGKPSRRWLWNGSTGCFQSGLHCVSYASYDYHGASSRCNCFWFYATDVPHASWRWVHTESEHPEIKGLWGSTVTWTSLPGWFAAPSKGIWISAFHPVPSSVWLHWQAAARSISVCPRCRATG